MPRAGGLPGPTSTPAVGDRRTSPCQCPQCPTATCSRTVLPSPIAGSQIPQNRWRNSSRYFLRPLQAPCDLRSPKTPCSCSTGTALFPVPAVVYVYVAVAAGRSSTHLATSSSAPYPVFFFSASKASHRGTVAVEPSSLRPQRAWVAREALISG